MKTIKAFATHSAFTTNTSMVDHPFGELSTQSRSYEKDIAVYANEDDKSITLNVFKSLDNNKVTLPDTTMVALTQKVAKWVYDYVRREPREIYPNELLPEVLKAFQGKAEAFKCGPVVSDGSHHCIQWISWQDPKKNQYRVWFSDASFRAEYDQFTIEIVPPVENLNVFFSTKENIETELKRFPIDILSRKANNQKGNRPVTVFRVDIFDWISPRPDIAPIPTNWYILIWGDAGDNIDSVKEALRNFILTHKTNTHSESEWKAIFPEIFKRSEFIIVPQWDVYANENKVREQASIYSPFANFKTIKDKYIKPYTEGYTDQHITEHTQIVGLYYRALTGYVIGSAENRDNKFKLQDVYPDYIDVPSTSTDFNYMSKETQDFSIALQNMLSYAETATEYSELPRDKEGEKLFTRVKRNDNVYLVHKRGNFSYLVLVKSSMKKST